MEREEGKKSDNNKNTSRECFAEAGKGKCIKVLFPISSEEEKKEGRKPTIALGYVKICPRSGPSLHNAHLNLSTKKTFFLLLLLHHHDGILKRFTRNHNF